MLRCLCTEYCWSADAVCMPTAGQAWSSAVGALEHNPNTGMSLAMHALCVKADDHRLLVHSVHRCNAAEAVDKLQLSRQIHCLLGMALHK